MRAPRAVPAALALALALVLAGACTNRGDDPAPVERPPRDAVWLVVTDIHFDPFADPDLVPDLAAAPASEWSAILDGGSSTPAGYGADTNAALLESALASMRATTSSPEVVFVVGDMLGHDFRDLYAQYAPDKSEAAFEKFVDATIAYIALELGVAFPKAQVVPVVGNNDSYCGDYESTPGSPFFANFASSWGRLVNRGGRAPDFARTFPKAGYYEARLPGAEGSTVVALNSVYWSAKYSNACGQAGQDPGKSELAWLKARLASPGRRLWMLSHVPPGIDVFASTRSAAPVPLLSPSYQQPLLDLLQPPRRWVLAIHGHLHMDTFRLLAPDGPGVLPARAVPSLGAPSISPLFGNNPAYLALRMDGSRNEVRDYTAYALDLSHESPEWTEEYAFGETYGVEGVNTASYTAAQRAIATPSPAQAAYQQHYTSGSSRGSIAGRSFGSYWCSNVALTPASFTSCVAGFPPPASPP